MKETGGDNYVTNSLVLSFINTFIKNLEGDGSISSTHESIKSPRNNVREDMGLRLVTTLV